LTFGNGSKNRFSLKPDMEVMQPWHNIKIDANTENKLVVKKACNFYKRTETYIIGEIISGVVQEGMRAKAKDKEFKVLELDCRMKGAPIAKSGMVVGLTVEGIHCTDLEKDSVLVFQN